MSKMYNKKILAKGSISTTYTEQQIESILSLAPGQIPAAGGRLKNENRTFLYRAQIWFCKKMYQCRQKSILVITNIIVRATGLFLLEICWFYKLAIVRQLK